MSKVLVNETSLTAIGDAIRSKNGTENKYKPSEMAAAIGAIPVGGNGGSEDLEAVLTEQEELIAELSSILENKASGGDNADILNAIIERTLAEISSNATAVGSYAFYDCKQLTKVNLPLATSIGSYGFYTCTNLVTVIIPSAMSIGSCAFGICHDLAEIDLPSVTSIAHGAFSYSALTALILRSESMAVLDAVNALNDTPIADGQGYIYVPSALVDTYKVGTNWATYADQFRALEDYTVDGTITGELDKRKI